MSSYCISCRVPSYCQMYGVIKTRALLLCYLLQFTLTFSFLFPFSFSLPCSLLHFNRAKTLPTVQSKRIRTESTVFKLYVLCWKKKKKKKKEKKRRKKGTKHTSLQLLWSRLQSRLHLFGLMLIIVRNYYVFHIIHFILFIYFYCQLFLRRFQSYDLIFTCQRKTNVSSFCSETAPRRR